MTNQKIKAAIVKSSDPRKCTHYWKCFALEGGNVLQVCKYCDKEEIVTPRFIKGNPYSSALYDGCFDSTISPKSIKFGRRLKGGIKL